MTSLGSTEAERNDTVKSEQKQELEKLRLRWNLECATAQKNKVAYVLKRSRDNYLRVMGSERGLLQYQAEVLELSAGIGNHKEVAISERERIVDIIDDVFSSVPEDTVLGKLRAELQEEVRGVFSGKKLTPAVFAPESSDCAPKDELILETKDIPGPSRRGIDVVRNKYTVLTVGAGLAMAVGLTGTSSQAYPANLLTGVAVDYSDSQTFTAGSYAPPKIDRMNDFYFPRMIYPFPLSTMSDGWGWRNKPCAECSSDHQGVDFNPGYGADVVSVMDGTVIKAEYSGEYGVHVYIHDGFEMTTIYAHMIDGSLAVNVGDKVMQGQKLGEVGDTGLSTGPHLHFAIMMNDVLVDPLPVLEMYHQRK